MFLCLFFIWNVSSLKFSSYEKTRKSRREIIKYKWTATSGQQLEGYSLCCRLDSIHAFGMFETKNKHFLYETRNESKNFPLKCEFFFAYSYYLDFFVKNVKIKCVDFHNVKNWIFHYFNCFYLYQYKRLR